MRNRLLKLLGFSLVELIITISIAGILTAIAVPTFSTIISNNRLTAYSNEFVTSLNLARSEAIKRGTRVTIKNSPISAPKQWELGWDVFVDIAGSPTSNTLNSFVDDGDEIPCESDSIGAPTEDCLLRTYTRLPNNLTLRGNSNFTNTISFNAMGKSKTGTLVLCDISRTNDTTKDHLKTAKLIMLTSTGRVRLGVDTDTPKNDIPNQSSGTDLSSCTL